MPARTDPAPPPTHTRRGTRAATELARTGMTMVCVTHEMGFARAVADRVVFVCEGQITEVADPDGFFTAPQTERARQFLQQIIH